MRYYIKYRSLMKEFARKKSVKNEIKYYAKSMRKSLLERLVEERKINFQNWNVCKMAYNKTYGIKFDKIPNLKGEILENIRKYIELRHKIIHSKEDMTMLNFDKVSLEESIFINLEFIEQAKTDFIEFMEKLYRETEAVD